MTDKPEEIVVPERIQCTKCKRDFQKKDFYLDKDRNPMHQCKTCMAMSINLDSRSTILPILKEIDIPFIPAEFETLKENYAYHTVNGAIQRKPKANQAVLGRYISKMKLTQYKDFRYSDSDRFIEEADQSKNTTNAEAKEKLSALLDEGYSVERALEYMQKGEVSKNETDDEKLNKKQVQSLRIKWGSVYQEDELIRLETLYKEMHDSYEIVTASHEDYLKQIVKTSLRMHSLIDDGDYETYTKLSSTYDKLMKSAKFTASQKKEEDRYIDSISEMVRLCEEVAFIPVYHKDEPQDIVDVTLRDLNNYTRNLVMGELNLGELLMNAAEQIKLEEEKDRMEEDFDGENLFDDNEISDEDFFKDVVHSTGEELVNEEVDLIEGGYY